MDAESVGTLKGTLHVTDKAHGRMTVGTEADSEVLGILWRHLATDLFDTGREFVDGNNLVV